MITAKNVLWRADGATRKPARSIIAVRPSARLDPSPRPGGGASRAANPPLSSDVIRTGLDSSVDARPGGRSGRVGMGPFPSGSSTGPSGYQAPDPASSRPGGRSDRSDVGVSTIGNGMDPSSTPRPGGRGGPPRGILPAIDYVAPNPSSSRPGGRGGRDLNTMTAGPVHGYTAPDPAGSRPGGRGGRGELPEQPTPALGGGDGGNDTPRNGGGNGGNGNSGDGFSASNFAKLTGIYAAVCGGAVVVHNALMGRSAQAAKPPMACCGSTKA